MNIHNTFKLLNNRCAFIPFITAGDPSLEITEIALSILDQEGADIIEVGLPYSDSLADGPIIQAAAERALRKGITINSILKLLEKKIPQISAPIVIFSYYNIILNYEQTQFIKELNRIGVKGLLVPDLPIEEAEKIIQICNNYNIELILLVSPTSSIDRIHKIAEKTQGCLYLVSSTGVTGIRKEFKSDLKKLIYTIKQITNKPIIVGFGISNEEQVKDIKSTGSNGIVIGSALVKLLSETKNSEDTHNFETFCKQIKLATR
uniref:tryptophan synthase alpha subunit n=1 Tax=Pulvinaster venetus TaxID=427767 RepID=UPI001FCD61E9|nr:tryptophan synthase alpha subunit [Pulvinaster venetus]UNJ17044.1 tryptophan synthase alpha subunit [Pulvinaster venetus]